MNKLAVGVLKGAIGLGCVGLVKLYGEYKYLKGMGCAFDISQIVIDTDQEVIKTLVKKLQEKEASQK